MKAITPIIAIIILLLITITLAAAGWTFLSGYTGSLLSKQIDISGSVCVGGDRVKIFVKNIGTASISTDEISVIDKDTGNPITSGARWETGNQEDPGLVLYYGFDTPGNPQDGSPYGNDGTVSAYPVWTPDGKIGGAYRIANLAYGDEAIIVPYDSSLAPSEFTVSLWARLEDHPPPGNSLVIKGAAGSGYSSSWRIYAMSGDNAYVFAWGSGTVFDGALNDGGSSSVIDKWVNLAATFDGTTMSFYKNGTLVATDPTVNFGYSGTATMTIGKGTAGVWPFNGTIDEIYLYNRVLSPEEIAAHATTDVIIPPGEIATMSHVCSSLKCTYVIGLSGYMREVKVNC